MFLKKFGPAIKPTEVTKNTRDFVTDSDVYYSDVRSDDSTEVYQVREYRPGDRMTRIHWKLSARQDEIMVRYGSRWKKLPSLWTGNVCCAGIHGIGELFTDRC